ncbi:MAG: AMP-binding protein [Haloarculaceae archaeon]
MESLEEFDEIVWEPDEEFVESTNLHAFMQEHDIDDYDELVERSTDDLEWFWDVLPDHLGIEFDEPYDRVRDDAEGPQFTDWYVGGKLNIAHNTLDRHAEDPETAEKAICIWEGEDGEVREVTFADVYEEANQVANALEARGVGTGDTVGLYMPMVPEVISILYGCFKVGAVAVPIFSGFGVDATATRIADSECSVLFTGDGFLRRGGEVTLKATADEAILEAGEPVEHTIVYDRLGHVPEDVPWDDERDETWEAAVESQDTDYETKTLPSDAESMLLYSSGTTGMPKGIVHTHAGALMQCAKEVYFNFDHKDDDRFFWVSNIGWMMGPWTLLGNHAFGGTIFMYEGAPDHPNPDRFWEMIDRHDLTMFGISPTAIRGLRRQGDEWVEDHDLSSLRMLGGTGEPWDPESWTWLFENVANEEMPIVNMSGGTEICGCFLMVSPIQPMKPCSLGRPGLGMDIDIVDREGESIRETHQRGYLVARSSCPSMTKSLWDGDERYIEEYWSQFGDLWNHGDWAIEDEDGYWFLLGRSDEVLNVSGRKVGPAEVEGALMEHPGVNQAAAVGVPDETTGTAVVAYVVLEEGVEETDELRQELVDVVGTEHGKPFRPREILFVDALPMTQSGKILRRAISSIYQDEDLGDLSALENPGALEEVREAR